MPALEKGFAKAGRARADFETSYTAFVITGSEAEREAARTMVKGQVSFYGSTPAYRPVLELHGWGDLQTELNGLSKQGKWGDMANLIDDEILHTFAIECELSEVADQLVERFGGAIDRTGFYTQLTSDADAKAEVIKKLQAA
jgi:hypothetical protein